MLAKMKKSLTCLSLAKKITHLQGGNLADNSQEWQLSEYEEAAPIRLTLTFPQEKAKRLSEGGMISLLGQVDQPLEHAPPTLAQPH